MSQHNHKQLFLAFALFSCALMISVSCSSDSESDTAEDKSETTKTDSEQKPASGDFFSGKPELAMIVSSSRANSTFDLQEAIELTVEIYSPQYSAYQTYGKTLGAGETAPDLSALVIGSDDNPWISTLELFDASDGAETPVPFAVATTPVQNQLKLGEGDIGLLHLLIEPGHFTNADSVTLRIICVESDREIDLAGETSIILRSDVADELQRNLSIAAFLMVSGNEQGALTLVQETVQAHPESYNARVALGSAYEKTGDLRAALSAYEMSLGLFEDKGDGHVPEAPKGLWRRIRELREKLEEQE